MNDAFRNVLLILALQFGLFAGAQEPLAVDPPSSGAATTTVEQPNPDRPNPDRPRPKERARRTYLDRIVASPMSHLGASWLVRPERQAEENAEKAMSQLGLEKGMTVCDLGCGNGYWTLPMATVVGGTGKVYAVDIQPEMLEQLQTRAAQASLDNIKPILGKVNDPRLPEDDQLDMVLMVDVYHEFSHPESMLWAIRRSLAPEGVIALLEYREEDPNVPIKPVHKMSKYQIMREYNANGLKLVREYNELPWQHLMFFARDDSPLPEMKPEPFVANQ
jgi:ubiquinone/menaquinone biosynthesis C-methylase UbiE